MLRSILYFVFSIRIILLLLAGTACFALGIVLALDNPAFLALAILGFTGCAFVDFALEDK